MSATLGLGERCCTEMKIKPIFTLNSFYPLTGPQSTTDLSSDSVLRDPRAAPKPVSLLGRNARRGHSQQKLC